MKFIIIRDNLREAVGVAEKVDGDNPNLPVLKNLLIEAENNKIKISSTNLEIAVSCIAAGKVIQGGRFTAPMKLFSNLINNLQSDRLNIEQKGMKLEIKTDNYEAAIQGISADEFPPTPKVQNMDTFIEIKGGFLKEALAQVLVSSQANDLRPELNSILLDFSVDSLKFAATDSFRLSERTLSGEQFESNHTSNFRILVPLRTAEQLTKIFKDEEVVRVHHDTNQILFKTERVELLSRLIEGNFPDYTAIVPQEFETEVVVKREDFANALKLASVLSNKNSEIRFKIPETKKFMEVSSSNETAGENKYVLSGKIKGGTEDVVFNWRYIADALKAIKTEEVFVGMNGESSPSEIKSVGDGSYFYIVKPIATA